MKLHLVSAKKHQSMADGMLFVRRMDILTTMVRIPIIVLGLLLVALTIPIQQSFASNRTLDFTIYSDGSTHVFYELESDPLEPESTVKLFGSTIENITIFDEDGFILTNELHDNIAIIETFGASVISADYDTQDLVSKTGKMWLFSVDAPTQYSLLLPKNTVIVEMNSFPISMQVENGQSYLVLPKGQTNISYYFSTPASAQSVEPLIPPTQEVAQDNSSILYVGGIIAAIVCAAVVIVIKKKKPSTETVKTIQKETEPEQQIDAKSIFDSKPDLREDDKEIINFLTENGGQAYESELRKRFLQPRTTMWRAVKRLERQEIIEIVKKDMQNLVKLKTKLGDVDE